MKYFGTILVVVSLAFVGSVYFVAHKTSCQEHVCFTGMHPEMVRGLAGYTCGCVTSH